VSEGCGEVGHWLIEVKAEGEVGEVWGEVVYWSVKATPDASLGGIPESERD
jgi:hypothetical protein